MKPKDAEMFADGIVTSIKKAITGPLVHGRMQALEARLAALEARPQLKYCGVWRSSEGYGEGSLATHSGSLWVAERPTTSTPGTADSGWKLIVKRGSV